MNQKRFLAAALTAMIVFFTLVLTSFPARAEFLTGNDLYARCTGNAMQQQDCLGYTSGVFDVLQNNTVCAPPTVTRGQVMDLVIVFLRQYPDIRHETADLIVGSLLTEMWPCKKAPATRGVL